LMWKLLKKYGFAPRTIVADKLRAYAAAFGHLGLMAWHHQAKWKNNWIEGSHVRVRRRERAMQGFRFTRIRPALPVNPGHRLQPLYHSPTSHLCCQTSKSPGSGFFGLARGGRCCRLNSSARRIKSGYGRVCDQARGTSALSLSVLRRGAQPPGSPIAP
jgi:hypothetical protein